MQLHSFGPLDQAVRGQLLFRSFGKGGPPDKTGKFDFLVNYIITIQ